MSRRCRPIWDRFWEKVDGEGDCWLWTRKLTDGYGKFWYNATRRAVGAHIVAYELLVGPVPDGLTLDHRCRVKACVNPGHLEPCPSGENARRSPLAPYWVRARRTICGNGHEYTLDSTIRHHGRRSCRVCVNAQQRAWRARRAGKVAAA